MTFTFTIKGRLPSLNQTLKIPKYAYFQSRRRQILKQNIQMWILGAGVPQFLHPVKIHFRWVEKNRRRDFDNIRAGAKTILDALVKQQRIVNDSQKWLTQVTDTYDLDKENPRVEVTISDALSVIT